MRTNRKWRWLRRHPRLPLYASCFFFAIMALAVKLLTTPTQASAWVGSHELPAVEVVFFRGFLCLLLLVPSLLRQGLLSPEATRGISWSALGMRSLAGSLAMICYFQAIHRLSLADAVLLNYTSPLWASLFAYLLLHESLSPAVLVAYPLAMGGIIMVVGAPGAGDDVSGYLLGLGSAVLAGAAYTALRGLRQTPPALVVAGLCVVTSLISAPFCLAVYQAPSMGEWALLWTCAGSSALAQIFMTLGYRWSSTASASTVGMATVAMSSTLSWGLLGDPLGPHQIVGIALLLAATSQTSNHSFLTRAMNVLLRGPSTAH